MKIKNKEIDQYLFKKIVNDKTLTRSQQAHLLGVSRQYLGILIDKLNLSKRIDTTKKSINKSRDELQSDYNNFGLCEQAKAYKICVATLYKFLKQNNIPLKREKAVKNKLEFEKVVSNENLTRKKQADILNISISTLHKYIKEFGISGRYNKMKQDRLEFEQAKVYKY